MSTELVQSSVYLTREQKAFLSNKYINFSKFSRAKGNQLMKKSEGQDLHSQPTEDTKTESVLV